MSIFLFWLSGFLVSWVILSALVLRLVAEIDDPEDANLEDYFWSVFFGFLVAVLWPITMLSVVVAGLVRYVAFLWRDENSVT